jgi:predicted ferric reductase
MRAAAWITLYLGIVALPLLVLLLGDVPPGVALWWDLSKALGFAAVSMIGVQFILTARFRAMASPFGVDIIYYLHRYLAIFASSPLRISQSCGCFIRTRWGSSIRWSRRGT